MKGIKQIAPYFSVVALFAMWGAFVWTGQSGTGEYIQAITAVLSGAGVHGIHQAVGKLKASHDSNSP